MIDEKKIEETAQRYCKVTDANEKETFLLMEGFKEGALWAQKEFVNSLWHDASEEPDDDKEIIISMNVGTIEEECVMLVYRKENPSTLFTNGCKKWCYLSDLLSKEGGEK